MRRTSAGKAPNLRTAALQLLLAVVALVVVSPRADAAELTIQDWLIAAQVHTSPFGSTDTADSGQPESPFQQTLVATVPPSSASATHDIEYAQSFGRFLIESSQSALGGPFGTSARTQASGTIWFTADAPIAFAMEAAFTYNLPPVSMLAHLSFRVQDVGLPGNPVILGALDIEHTFVGEPASGTLAFDESAVLPAGHSYMVTYLMRISTEGGPFNAFGTANGHVNFTLDLLPEPATAILLLCALPLLRHRRPI